MSQQWVMATGNAGKVKELTTLLSPLGIEVVPQTELGVGEVVETGTTFVENAIIKARHASRITGLPAIADDSGLAVDALGGAPGIYSARYAGDNANDEQNIDKLLSAMQATPEGQRSARFICALVFMRHADDPIPLICQGQWQGQIALTRQGDGGFGYDPVFWPDNLHCSAAELPKAVKNTLSHRAQAMQQLLKLLDHHIA
ncbi:RdgB/HAM1 family non-canonical purine NTP pyrophosphatase [Aliiglaciecola sp. CAU 1673]|uniref:RdgB/HAM1 family non-canonical purine NTP pyrophosphatase n=1 Tax=Aliiglaciecola sp. CAU 1673 TaxID=3032595 RepID=UPI0023DC4E08|nr:RdgB/HAM1 family non-canonical purine NTP pyrophosphatase [Aliiglaciecola sp. CAU 1673]MDF2177449.1 RdgB/HAM1 family non-canonical purine NTP pyrophosphatase [Aliiglaciecola sp. CAU 1673]